MGYACNDDDYIPEDSSTVATIEEVLPDSTAQEPDSSEVPAVVPPQEPVTVPVGLSNVYLLGHAVKSIEFENDYVWAATDSFLVKLDKLNKTLTYYPYPDIVGDMQCLLKSDKNGVKWIVRSNRNNKNNMYSFDGNKWDKIEFNESGSIYSLAVDKNNAKWITASDLGGYIHVAKHVYKLDQGSWIHYTPENSGVYYDYTYFVTSDRNGNIWITNYGNLGDLFTADLALIKYDGEEWTPYFSDSRLFWTAICIDSQGNPWIQQLFSIRKLDMASNSLQEQINFDIDCPYILNAVEGENKLWFSNNLGNGIAVYTGSDWHYYTTSNSELPSNKVYQIKIDSDGTKWIGTSNGLARLE